MLIYFLKGQLPWDVIKGSDSDQVSHRVLEMKESISAEELCEDLPQEFPDYFHLIRSTKLAEFKLLYRRLRKMFDRLYSAKGYQHDNIFDFTVRLHRTAIQEGTFIPARSGRSA